MTMSNWINRLFERKPRTIRKAAPRFRPLIETLETRLVPASYSAATAADLIADIAASNQVPGNNSITLTGTLTSALDRFNPYTLTGPDNTTDGPTGLPVIVAGNNLTISGDGRAISREYIPSSDPGSVEPFRLFDVASGASLELDNVTLYGGAAQGTGNWAQGGAIYSAGKLILNNVTVENSSAVGDLQIAPVNTLPVPTDGEGGAIYIKSGTANITNSAFVFNGAAGEISGAGPNHFDGSDGLGGGMYVAGGDVQISGSTFVFNRAEGGMGATATGTVGGNGGNGYGGALEVAGGSVTLFNTTLNQNSAKGGMGGEGTIINLQVNPTPGQSGTFEPGMPGNGGDGVAGGVYISGGTFTVFSSTIAGNTAYFGRGAPAAVSGDAALPGISTTPGVVSPGGYDGSAACGGVDVAGGNFISTNSIFAQNGQQSGLAANIDKPIPTSPSDIDDFVGLVLASDHNLIGAYRGSFDTSHDIINPTSVGLGSLADNGGPTKTMALLPGSPAIDAGDDQGVRSPYDQRGPGFARVVGSHVDIGAYESQHPSQTISFGPLANQASGATVTLSATSSSDLPVSFAVKSGQAKVSGNILSVVGVGTIVVEATQAGNGTYSAAPPVDQSFVARAPTLISVSASSATPVYGQSETFTATVTAPTSQAIPTSSDGTVTFYDGSTQLGLPVTLSGSPATATFTIPALTAGPHTITASYSGDSYFMASNTRSVVPVPGLNGPDGVAVDRAGDLFIADQGHNRVVEVKADGSQTTVGSGLSAPTAVAVDGQGDVFIADAGNNRVVEVTPSALQTTVASGLSTPWGVAVNSAGNVFIAEPYSNQVVEVTSSGVPVATISTGLNAPFGVAVDRAGDLFIADTNNNRVVELTGGRQTTLGSGLLDPTGVAVDSAGDVFIADWGNSRVVEVPAHGTQTTVATGFEAPFAVAVDSWGDLFIADAQANQVVEATPVANVMVSPLPVTLSGSRTYDGTSNATASSLSITNLVSGDNVTLSGSATLTSANAGTEAISSFTGLTLGGSAAGNYTLTGANGSVNINQAPLTVTANPLSKTVGATDPSLTCQVTAGNLVGNDALSGSLTRDPGEDVGAYTIRQGSLTAGANYALTFVNSVLLITATNDSLVSGQTVGVSSTVPCTAATTPASAGAAQLSATGGGFDGSLTAAQYQGAPVNGFAAAGSYFDIYVGSSNLGSASSVQATFTNLTPGAVVFWLNGGSWQPVTDASGLVVIAGPSGTATVTLTTATSPSLGQLTGTDFFAGTFQPTLTAAAGGTAVVGTGGLLTATATLAGGDNEAGSITFTLYDPSGKQVDVQTVSVSGNGTYATPKGFLPTVAGTYQWVAAYTSSDRFNRNAATTPGATPEVAAGSGVTVVGDALYLVGGSNTNDEVNIKPTGTSNTGSTGIVVDGKLNGVDLHHLAYNQSFGTVYVVGFDGNEHVQEDAHLAIATVVHAGNGNDEVHLGNGNNTVTLGDGNDEVQAGDGANIISVGNGNDHIAVGNGNNVVVEGNGNDQVQAGDGDNLLVGGLGHHELRAGNGRNILIDGAVNDSMGALDAILIEWAQSSSNADDIRHKLQGLVTYNDMYDNTLQAGSGLDWFWANFAKDKLNNKSNDLLN